MDEKPPLQLLSTHTKFAHIHTPTHVHPHPHTRTHEHTRTHTHRVLGIREMDEKSLLTRELNVNSLTL